MVTIKNTQIDIGKYSNALLYFIKYCNNKYLGATKLNKLLYYLDFISYRDRGRSVTKDIYVHKQYGPVPSQVDDILIEIHKNRLIDIERIDYKDGETFKYTLIGDTKPDEMVFDDYEKTLLKNLCDQFHLWSTDKIVEQTHLEAPWFYSTPFNIVDYDYASDIDFFMEAAQR